MLSVLLPSGVAVTANVEPAVGASANVGSDKVASKKKVVVLKRKVLRVKNAGGDGGGVGEGVSSGVGQVCDMTADYIPICGGSGMHEDVREDGVKKPCIGGSGNGVESDGGRDDGVKPFIGEDGAMKKPCIGGSGNGVESDGGRDDGVKPFIGEDGAMKKPCIGGSGNGVESDGGRDDGVKPFIGEDGAMKKPCIGVGGGSERHVVKKPGTIASRGVRRKGIVDVKGEGVDAKRRGGVAVVSDGASQRVCGGGDVEVHGSPVENRSGRAAIDGNMKKAVRVKRKVLKAGSMQMEGGGSPTSEAAGSFEPTRAKEGTQKGHYLEVTSTPKCAEKRLVKEEVDTSEPMDVLLSAERKKSLAEIKAEM